MVDVSQLTVEAQPTAVIAEATSWEAYPELWPRLLDEVWSAVRPRGDEVAPGRNVMLYKDDVPNVQVGVEVAGSFAPIGRIIASELPAGRVVTATHRGSWDVGPAHRAVVDECRRLGLDRVLLTCLPDNIPSRKVILANGGVETDNIAGDDRFWIGLQ